MRGLFGEAQNRGSAPSPGLLGNPTSPHVRSEVMGRTPWLMRMHCAGKYEMLRRSGACRTGSPEVW